MMPSHHVLLCLLLSLSTGFGPQPTPRERQTAGFVRKMQGEWEHVVGQRIEQVVPGQALLAGADLRPKHRGRTVTIEIVRANEVKFPDCLESSRTLVICEKAVRLPYAPEPRHFGARVVAAVSRFFGAREGTFVSPMVRGSAPVLEDGIAILEGGRIELHRVLKRVAPGQYTLRFAGLPAADTSRPQASTVTSWTAEVPFDLDAPGALGHGLYLLTVPELRESAWILVVRRADLQHFEAAVTEVESVTSTWPLGAADKKGLRRALLEQLSRESAPRFRS